MRRLLAVASLALVPAAALAAAPGKVTLPLPVWEGMLTELAAAKEPVPPPIVVLPLERTVSGALRKGLLTAKLVARFQVLESTSHVRVPVLDGDASLGEVRLNGQRTSLLREGALYSVGVDRPGIYRLEVDFFWGREQDRFARRLSFRLPPAGPTRLSVVVPETDIEAKLQNGVLLAQTPRGGSTELVGHLDPSGSFDLSWNRKLTYKSRAAVRWQSRLFTVFTVQEAVIQGVAAFDLEVLAGEAERVELRLPPAVEVLRVEGDAVLQWQTEVSRAEVLTVLFRHLVERETRVTVHFQLPVEPGEQVALRTPLPPAGVPVVGAFGVQGPAGLSVEPVGRAARAVESDGDGARDLPVELTELTASPLLFGESFTAEPEIALKITRHAEVELTATIIDNLQASTVLNEDGVEVTKVKLRMRNNTRQYLRLRLPPGSVLTHSLIDGQPVRPAVSHERGEVLLFPLRQSERLSEGRTRWHVVGDGETLSDIANFYYSDPGQWQEILTANPGELHSEHDLWPGQRLRLPVRSGATVQESSFVIELAFKRQRGALGWAGRAALRLPEVDVDTVEATWHLFVPDHLEPLVFDANLTQYSAIRYDPFRRLRDFLERAFWVRDAWAGGYQNILRARKGIFTQEAGRAAGGKMILSAFPLVGERYRFKQILLGQKTPALAFTYVDERLVAPLRLVAFAAAFVVALLLVRRWRDRRWRWIAAGVGLGLFILAYFVLGMHRRMLWGVDLALALSLVRLRAAVWWAALRPRLAEPWRLVADLRLLTVAALFGAVLLLYLVLAFPLLLSSIALVLLAFACWLNRAALTAEVRHG